MPPNERVGTHNRQQLPPLDESRQQDEGDAGRVVGALRSDLAFEVAGELLPQEQVLGRELRAGPEHQSQQPQQVSEQGKRRSEHVRRSYRFDAVALRNAAPCWRGSNFCGVQARRMPAQVEAVAERLRRKGAFFGAEDVDIEIATGAADGAILEFATRSDADLVVMGIADRSWMDRLLFGSTLRRVLRRATVPVLVIPVVAGDHAWADEPVVKQISGRVSTQSAVDRVAA